MNKRKAKKKYKKWYEEQLLKNVSVLSLDPTVVNEIRFVDSVMIKDINLGIIIRESEINPSERQYPRIMIVGDVVTMEPLGRAK